MWSPTSVTNINVTVFVDDKWKCHQHRLLPGKFLKTHLILSVLKVTESDRMTLSQCQNQNKGPDTFLSVTNVRISVVVVYAVDREF